MPDVKIISNRRIGWFFGPATGINWDAATRASLLALENFSGALRIGGSDFGLQATEMTSDPTFSDEAGAQELGYANFGGNVSNIIPAVEDTTSSMRKAHTTLKTPHADLVVAQRFGQIESEPLASGDEVNVFHVATTAETVERRQNNYSQTTELVAQDDVLVNYVIPGATAATVIVGGTSGGSLASAGGGFVWATYQGVKVTAGVTWISSNPNVAIVWPNGFVEYKSVGSTNITATYPGGTVSTALAVAVTA